MKPVEGGSARGTFGVGRAACRFGRLNSISAKLMNNSLGQRQLTSSDTARLKADFRL